MAMQMHLNGLIPVLVIDGELSIYTAAELKPQLYTILMQQPELELDLSGVSEMDSAGLQLLIAAKREATYRGQILRLSQHSPAVLEVFDLCNMAGFFGDPLIISDRQHG